MTEMVDGSISGTLDTRPLAPLLDPEGGEEALCELMQDTLGVPCLECGGSDPGEFCLEVVAVDLVAPLVPDETLLPVSCEDIITGFLSGGTCESQAMGFDPDADGSFSGCPGFGG